MNDWHGWTVHFFWGPKPVYGMHLLHHFGAFTCSCFIIFNFRYIDTIVEWISVSPCQTVPFPLPFTHRLSIFLFSAGDVCSFFNARLVFGGSYVSTIWDILCSDSCRQWPMNKHATQFSESHYCAGCSISCISVLHDFLPHSIETRLCGWCRVAAAIFRSVFSDWGRCHPICILKSWIQTLISPTSLAAFRTGGVGPCMRRTGEPEMQKCEISRFFYRKREISEI